MYPPRIHSSQLLTTVLLLYVLICSATAATYTVVPTYELGFPSELPSYSWYAVGVSIPAASAGASLAYTASLTSVSTISIFSLFSILSGQNNAMAMFGPAGTGLMYQLYNTGNNFYGMSFVAFGPLTQSVDGTGNTIFLSYVDQVYFTMPSEQAQAAGIMVMLASRDLFPKQQSMFRVGSIGIAFSSSLLYGELESSYGITVNICKVNSNSAYSSSTYNSCIGNKPGIFYQYGQSEEDSNTITWTNNIVTDPTLIELNSTVATTFELHYPVLQLYNAKASSGATMLPPENVVTGAPVPGVDAMEYAVAVDFETQVGSMFSAGMSQCLKNFLMAGWVSGTALMQALNKYTGTTAGNSAAFAQNLYAAQSSFVVSDLFIGTFASNPGSCSSTAMLQGLLCGCHHAGNNVWFYQFVKSGNTYDVAAMSGLMFQYALGYCANLIPPGDMVTVPDNSQMYKPYTVLIQTPVPIHVAGFAPTDNTMMETVCTQTHDVITRLSNTNLYQHTSTHTYRGYCISSAVNTVSTALATHTSTFVMTSMMGVMPDTVTTPTTLVLDYIPQTTQPHVSQANLVYLFPTLEQDLYVLASYLGGIVTDASVVCAAVSSSTVSGSIVTLLTTTLATFGISLTDDHVAQPTNGLAANIPAGCSYTFAIGMGEDDAAGLLSYLQTNANSYLLVPFDDLTKYYTSLSASLGSAGAAVTNRFLFATNIPLWTSVASNPTAAAASAPLSTVSQFLQSVPVGLQTPAAVRAYFVAMLYDQMSAGEEPQTGDMQQRLYDSVSVTVSGVEFGPFSTQCTMNVITSTETTCLYNYGAGGISVWSYTSVVNPTAAALQGAITPSLVYDGVVSTVLLPLAAAAGSGNCVEEQDSSYGPTTTTTTTTTTTPGPTTVSTTKGAEALSSFGKHDDSSDGSAMNTLIIVVGVCLGVAIVVILLLLLVKYGVMKWCLSYLRCGLCRGTGRVSGVLRGREKQHKESLALQRAAQDVSRAPSVDATQPLTVVCVDVAHFRALWTTAPDVMSRAVADYQRCVRQSIVRHGCYEVNTVDGLFVIACCTADDGVRVALDCAAAAQSLDAKSAAAVNAAYVRLGCASSVPAGCGLRLRIAVHCGPASTGAGAGARFRGGAVDDAVCAAYCSKVAWQVVVTESARCSLADAGAHDLASLCKANLLHSGATELFVVTKQEVDGGSAATTALLPESAAFSIQCLAAGDQRPDGAASGFCRRNLGVLLSSCNNRDAAAYVTAVAQCLGLLALSREDYVSENAYSEVVLGEVCGRLGGLIELRHGIGNEAAAEMGSSGAKTVSPEEGKPASQVRWTPAVVAPAVGFLGSSASPGLSPRIANRRRTTREGPKNATLRHFSYVNDDEGVE